MESKGVTKRGERGEGIKGSSKGSLDVGEAEKLDAGAVAALVAFRHGDVRLLDLAAVRVETGVEGTLFRVGRSGRWGFRVGAQQVTSP